MLEKDIVKGKSRNLMDSMDRVPNLGEKPKTGDKLPKRNSHSSDGDKYMSYIKVGLSTYFVFFSEQYLIGRETAWYLGQLSLQYQLLEGQK